MTEFSDTKRRGEFYMASLLRRLQRAGSPDGRRKPSGIPFFGSKLGVRNPQAKDLLARQRREKLRASRSA